MRVKTSLVSNGHGGKVFILFAQSVMPISCSITLVSFLCLCPSTNLSPLLSTYDSKWSMSGCCRKKSQVSFHRSSIVLSGSFRGLLKIKFRRLEWKYFSTFRPSFFIVRTILGKWILSSLLVRFLTRDRSKSGSRVRLIFGWLVGWAFDWLVAHSLSWATHWLCRTMKIELIDTNTGRVRTFNVILFFSGTRTWLSVPVCVRAPNYC
jgi:hypothetical protein